MVTVSACAPTQSAVPAMPYSSASPSASALAARGQLAGTTKAPDEWFSGLPAGTRATRIVYRSVSGVDGSSTTVSGAVFVPAGHHPDGGWPLIAYAHGTTGVTRDCGPSDRPDMFGDLRAVDSFVASGYAVVTTDYQGLSLRASAPRHPYLEPRTAAYNVIDAVRAARSAEPAIGNRWVAVGSSQGGAAVWSAAEHFASYGSDAGTMLGAAAAVPLLDASYLVDRAQSGQLTPDQRWLYPILVEGVAQANPHIRADDYLHGEAAERQATLVSCVADKSALSSQIQAADTSIFDASPPAAERLRSYLGQISLPRVHTDVPILAMYGSVDEIIPVDRMEIALGKSCALGDSVERVRHEGAGHSLDPGPLLGQWISARFVDRPAPSNC
ncbi:putative secretory lipase [Gordonia polyisoprenivorans VH2]|uniref:Putative secretory lipase n=1 Tax=Gordonia polyisoprenivorans (strain DSM 44266 / VH2) TaxID=1112204 RepID=H6N1F4_GORPV|nr:putative secretory lipase [Gordonia polyisoprenivorans VH2]